MCANFIPIGSSASNHFRAPHIEFVIIFQGNVLSKATKLVHSSTITSSSRAVVLFMQMNKEGSGTSSCTAKVYDGRPRGDAYVDFKEATDAHDCFLIAPSIGFFECGNFCKKVTILLCKGSLLHVLQCPFLQCIPLVSGVSGNSSPKAVAISKSIENLNVLDVFGDIGFHFSSKVPLIVGTRSLLVILLRFFADCYPLSKQLSSCAWL